MKASKAWVIVLVLGLAGLAMAQRAQAPGERWDEEDLVTVDGTVTDVDLPFAEVDAAGETYVVHFGPTWYWSRMGYRIQRHDRVVLSGQVSEYRGTLHLYPHSMERDGETYRFADEDGAPLWSRGGRWAGRGWGGRGWGGHYGHGYGHGRGHGPCGGDPSACPCRAATGQD